MKPINEIDVYNDICYVSSHGNRYWNADLVAGWKNRILNTSIHPFQSCTSL